jgi:predicted nuclease of restriction endonuclease-like (RecB) superfamily
LTLNQETIRLYWSIGQDLSSRFAAEGWGTKVVDRQAKDLGNEFPGVEGFSLRNLRYMRSFAEAWPVTFRVIWRSSSELFGVVSCDSR